MASNEALLPMYKTLVYALSLPISILIIVNNTFLLAVLYKKPKLCGISSTATINLSGTAMVIGLVEFVFCLILSGDSWRYYSPTVAVIKYVLIAIPHLSFTLILAFISFQRFVYKSQSLKQINPRKTCISILVFWFVAIILIAVPLAHYDVTKLDERAVRVVFLYGRVLIALGLANSKITYVSVLIIVCLLNGAILGKIASVEGLLTNKAVTVVNTVSPIDPIVIPAHAPASLINGSSVGSSKGPAHQNSELSTNPSQISSETPEHKTTSNKMTKALICVYGLYYGLCTPYFLIVILILSGVKDYSKTGQALSICEILAYYAFLATFALYPFVFIFTIRSVRAYLWKLIC